MQQESNVQYIASIEEMLFLFRNQNMLPMMFISLEKESENTHENAVLASLYQRGYVDWKSDQVICCEPMTSILDTIKKSDKYLSCVSYTETLDSFVYYLAETDGVILKPESFSGKTLLLGKKSANELKRDVLRSVQEEFNETMVELYDSGNPEKDYLFMQFTVMEKSTGKLIHEIDLVENGISDILVVRDETGEEERKRFSMQDLVGLLNL